MHAPTPTIPATTSTTPSIPPSVPQSTAAGQSGTALTIAIVGIVGTLIGVLITHWLTTRREEKRWDREREQERVKREWERVRDESRWERERTERREQWRREDEFRWREVELKAYSALSAGINQWLHAAREARPVPETGRNYTLEEETLKKLQDAQKNVLDSIINLELLASEGIRGGMWKIYEQTEEFVENLMMADHESKSPQAAANWSAKALKDVESWNERMRHDVRNLLGI